MTGGEMEETLYEISWLTCSIAVCLMKHKRLSDIILTSTIIRLSFPPHLPPIAPPFHPLLSDFLQSRRAMQLAIHSKHNS